MLFWLIKAIEVYGNFDFSSWGVMPRSVSGLKGILTSPFIHVDWLHLFSNTFPLLILGTCLFYFYGKIAGEVLFWSWLMCGLWLWIFGRESYHIGASGIIYALSSFLFFSGVIKRSIPLAAVSLIVVFLYGSLIWGVLPIDPQVSWEGHLTGAVAGLVNAIFFRKKGPVREKQQEPDGEDEDPDPDDSNPYWMEGTEEIDEEARPLNIRYHFRKKE